MFWEKRMGFPKPRPGHLTGRPSLIVMEAPALDPYSTERGRLEVLLLAMQELGKPGVHQVKMFEWGLRAERRSNPRTLGEI